MTAFLHDAVAEAVSNLRGVGTTKILVSTGWTRAGKVFVFVIRTGRIAVKLANEAQAAELMGIDGTEPLRIGNKKPAKHWYLLPESLHDDAEELRLWLERAFNAMPEVAAPKKKKKTAKR